MTHSVVVAAYQGLLAYEYAIVCELFGLDRVGLEHIDYELGTCAVEQEPIYTSHGLRVTTHGGALDLADADTVVVAGWRDISERPTQPFLEALSRAHESGVRIVGICSGAFPLAHAGLLDDQVVTTHWMYADEFRDQFPHIELNPDPLYILGTNNTATSAGSSAGLDLCLALISMDHTSSDAAEIARRMVVTQHRPGFQSQFTPTGPPPIGTVEPLGNLFDWIEQDLGRDLSISQLAKHAHLSRRTLIRRFNDATGSSPHAWITQRRIARARSLLETTPLSVARIATLTGLGTAANLRKHLSSATGLSPTQYRMSHNRSVS